MPSPCIQLKEEVDKLKELGVNVGSFSNEASSVVRFALDTDFLNKFTAKQWGIVPKKPVIVQLKFEEAFTAAADIPGVFIFQSSDSQLSESSLNDYETEFGVVQWFLETRLTEVLRSNWEKRPDSVRNRGSSMNVDSTSVSITTTTTTTEIASSTTSSSATTVTTTSNPPPSLPMYVVDESMVKQIEGLGFPADKARAALGHFKNNLELALNHLLTNPDGELPNGTETTSMEIDSGDKKNSNSNTNCTTPEKGKNKRQLSTSDDDTLAQLVGMGFDMESAAEALADHPAGTSLEVIQNFVTPKKRRGSDGEVDKEKLEVLKGLGFSPSEATNALYMAQGDLAKAVELVEGAGEESPSKFEEEAAPRPAKGRRGRRTRATMFHQAPPVTPVRNAPSRGKANADDVPVSKNEVNLWTDAPFLVNLYNYISMRFITCPGYCLICDRDLDITTYKLPVCGRAECVRVYEQNACGSNQVITELKEQPAVVELLLNLLCACMTSPAIKGWNRNGNVLSTHIDGTDGSGGRRNYAHNYLRHNAAPQSFEPFPYNLGFEFDDGTQNIDLLRKTVDAIPPIGALQHCSSDVHLQAYLDDMASPLAFPLLRWILRSSRAHLSLIPSNKQLEQMGTPYQFQIVSTNPEHERVFQKWKRQARDEKPRRTAAQKRQSQQQMLQMGVQPQYVPRPGGGFMIKPDEPTKEGENKTNTGSFHAFHGSPVSNWHSIVRTGLRGGHVPGIYMAQAAAVSQGYMQMGATQCSGWQNSAWNCDKMMSCMGMVEVADMCHHTDLLTGVSPVDAAPVSLNGIINVAMDYSIVVTRYLFFWPQGLFPGMDTTNNPAMMYGYSPFTNVIANKLIKNEFMFLDDEEDKEEKDLNTEKL